MLEAFMQKLDELELNQYGLIDVQQIIFSDDVRKMCEMNSCGQYGKNWQCPPGVGSVESRREEVLSFPFGLLFNMVYPLEDSYDWEGMQAAGADFKQKFEQVKDAVTAHTSGETLFLGAGACSVCQTCAYQEKKPCRFPERATASMEASGIDVYTISGNFGFKYINGVNTVTYFGLALFHA